MRRTYPYIFMTLFAISAWLLMVIFSGCAPSFNPNPDCLRAIEDRPYVPGEYTCWQKSKDACKCLKENGYDARVVIGNVRGYDVRHAWVEIKYEGKIYWLEPTWGWGCWEKSKWTDRTVINAKADKRSK